MTIDVAGNAHRPAGTPTGGQFAGKVNTAPAAGLTAEADPTTQAREFIATPAPEGLSTEAAQGYLDASQRFDSYDLFRYQPLSYVGFLADQAHEHAAKQLARATDERGRDYWESATARLDAIADRMYELAGTNRRPVRDPRHIGEDTRTPEEVWGAVLDGRATRWAYPAGIHDTRAALNPRAAASDAIPAVQLDWDSVPPRNSRALDVTGPDSGRPIVIDVKAGCPDLKVTRGHAVIRAGGNGFGIEVARGARVTVIGEPDRKVSITAKEGAVVDFHPDPTTRGYQLIEGGATFRMHGQAHKVSLSSDER